MKKSKAFNSIMAGLKDALAYAKGDKTRCKVHKGTNRAKKIHTNKK